MYKPKAITICVQEKKKELPQKKLSKSLVALLAIYQLGFGFHFGFVNVTTRKFNTFIHFVTGCMACIMTLFLSLVSFERLTQYWMFIYFIQYVPTFFILISSKYRLLEFLNDLKSTNKNPLSNSKDNKVGLIAWMYTVSMFVLKFTTSVTQFFYHNACNTNFKLIIHIVSHIPMISLDFIPVANFLIFHHVYARMRDVKIELEGSEIKLEELQSSFKEIADRFERFRKYHDAIFIVGFLTEFPKWMIIIWHYLNSMKSTEPWIVMVCTSSWAVHATVQICVPAVFAEMINVQTEAMKMILHGKISVEADERKMFELTRLLRYVEARPLLRKAWRLVPVDLRLPINMLSLCTTYLIVIIQFTHLYD